MEPKIKQERKNIAYTAVPTETVGKNKETGDLTAGQPLKPIERSTGPKFGKRHIQALTYFLFVVLEYCERVNMSIAIVAMTDPKSTKKPNIPTYNWPDKAVVLSSFFWGYTLAPPVSGWLTHRYRPKWFLIGSLCICSLLGFSVPLMAANYGSKGVIAIRIVQGLSQSLMLPSVSSLLAKWVPPSERTRFIAFVFSGLDIGVVVSLLLSGFMAASWYGWPLVFYSFSAVGLAWCVLFSYVGCDGPQYHSTITEEEKRFIENSLKYCGAHQTKSSIPWRKILTSMPFWALLFLAWGCGMIDYTLITELPSYMAHVLKFNLKSNGLLSSLPYLTRWVFVFVCSYTSRILERKTTFSNTTIRKIFITVGSLVILISFILLGNNGPNEATKTVILLVVTITAMAASQFSMHVNYLDLSPRHAGFLSGVAAGFYSWAGIVSPLLVHFIVVDETDPDQWKIIFYLSASMAATICLFFIVFGSAQLQPWSDDTTTEGEE